MPATAVQVLSVLGERFAADGVDRGRWTRLAKYVREYPRGSKPGDRAPFTAAGGAALALSAALPWLPLPAIGPAVTSLLALLPHPLTEPVPEPLASVLHATARGRPTSGRLLPGETFGDALAGLIEALAGPRGGELEHGLTTGGFNLQIRSFPPPFGLVGAVSITGIAQLYTARRVAMDDYGRGRIVPGATLPLEIFTTMAPMLAPVREEKMAA